MIDLQRRRLEAGMAVNGTAEDSTLYKLAQLFASEALAAEPICTSPQRAHSR